jgi:hypothetical protein
VAGYQRSRDNQKKRGAGEQQRETMQTPVHYFITSEPICDWLIE